MNTLYLEVIASIVAAAVLGLVAGWFVRDIRAKRRLRGTISEWKKKLEGQDEAHEHEIEELESRLESVSHDVRELTSANRKLKSRTDKDDVSVDKARSDAIELNRKQAELQERLQRIIRQKDREITALQGRTDASEAGEPDTRPAAARQDTSDDDEVEAYIDSLANRGNRLRNEAQSLNRPTRQEGAGGATDQVADKAAGAAAIAAAGVVSVAAAAASRLQESLAGSAGASQPTEHDSTRSEPPENDLPEDDFDATAIIDFEQARGRSSTATRVDTGHDAATGPFDDTLPSPEDELDQTEVADYDDTEEATVALDEEALAQVRGNRRRTD